MPSPATLLAALFCIVAGAAAAERRHAAMAAWFGVALALSGWAALIAPVFVAIAHAPRTTGALASLAAAGATLALTAFGLPHAFGVPAAFAGGAAGLAVFAYVTRRPAGPHPILARAIHRIG